MPTIDFRAQVAYLADLLHRLVGAEPIPFADVVPSVLPPKPGVYRIFETGLPHDTVYLGQSDSLRARLYGSHLMGNVSASTLKKKLLRQGRYPDTSAVKGYLRHDCSLQYLIVDAAVERVRLEHFAIAVLKPWFND